MHFNPLTVLQFARPGAQNPQTCTLLKQSYIDATNERIVRAHQISILINIKSVTRGLPLEKLFESPIYNVAMMLSY
jgi:hypothetical protein